MTAPTSPMAAQDKFRLLAENASDVVFLIQGSGLLEWVSPSVTAVSGWTPEELVGTEPWELVHEDDRAGALTALAEAALTHSPLSQIELRMRKRDGSYLWMSASGHPVVTDGVLMGLVIGLRDVTAQRDALSALAASELRFRLLAENASDVVLLIQGSGFVEWVSPSVLALTGWTADSLVGSQPWDLVHPDDRDEAVTTLAAAATSEETMPPILVRIRSAKGTYSWVSATGRQVPNEAGDPCLVVNLRLVDDLVEARVDADRHRALLQASIDSLLDPHVILRPVLDEAGTIVDFTYMEANEAACLALGHDVLDLVDHQLTAVLPGDAGLPLFALCCEVMASGEPLRRDDYLHEVAGGGPPLRIDIRGVRVGDALSLTWRDVAARHVAAEAMRAASERYRLMAENSSDVVIGIPDREVIWVSPTISETLGWSREEWVGRRVDEYVHPDDWEWFSQATLAVSRGEAQVIRIRMLTRVQKYHWVEASARPYTDGDGNRERAVMSFRLVDSEVAAEQELEHRARTDELTGLLSRRELFERLGKANHEERVSGDRLAVLFCDLDDFKGINDSAGHAAGDELLRVTAARIRACVRIDDLVGRVGGDEILVVLTGVHDESESIVIAEKIRSVVAAPVLLPLGPVSITMSIGITLAANGEHEDAVVARADRAMYVAKESGRDRVVSLPAGADPRPPAGVE